MLDLNGRGAAAIGVSFGSISTEGVILMKKRVLGLAG